MPGMSRIGLLTRTTVTAFRNLQQEQCVWLTPAAANSFHHISSGGVKSSAFNTCGQTNYYAYLSARNVSSATWSVGSPALLSLAVTQNANTCLASRYFGTKGSPDRAGKSDTKASPATADADIFGETSNLTLFAKFKLMYKQYWYVLIPVHVITSFSWVGAFYYMSKCGVDIPALLQYIHLSDTIIQKVQNSNMGHAAIAYLCYKIITPVRYAVTVGATTVSIKYLVQRGHIKPIPSKKQIIEMYTKKKADRAAAKAEKENN